MVNARTPHGSAICGQGALAQGIHLNASVVSDRQYRSFWGKLDDAGNAIQCNGLCKPSLVFREVVDV
jgi:hypothetical protein